MKKYKCPEMEFEVIKLEEIVTASLGEVDSNLDSPGDTGSLDIFNQSQTP